MKVQVVKIAMTRILMIYLLSNFIRITVAFDEIPPPIGAHNLQLDQIDSYDLNEFPNKRSYTYVSEYKRLPVYNFGLGKRETDNQGFGSKRGHKSYSFGLGKRSAHYNFGIGKRNYESLMDLDYSQLNNYDSYLNADVSDEFQNKRASRLYNFGVGKRSLDSVYEDKKMVSDKKKRADEDSSRKFLFGLGKKSFGDEKVLMIP